MNLQRREEIRELIAEIASAHIEGMSTAIEIRALDAMRELLADPPPDQAAAHDGEEGFEPELRTLEARGVTVEDHGRLNYIRASAKGAQRDRAGALLVKLANLPGVAK